MTARARLVLGLFGLLFTGCAHAASEGSNTTICKISSHEGRYVGAIVRLKAVYHTTFDHGAYLKDAECPKTALQDLTPESTANASVVDFYRRVTPDLLGTQKPGQYLVEVVGRVVSAKDVPVRLGIDRRRVPLGIEFEQILAYELIKR